MKLSRRQFLQGLAAGIVVASAPAAVRAAVVDETEKHIDGGRWGFIVRGGQEDLIMVPPGVAVPPHIGERGVSRFTYWWPEDRFDVEKIVSAAEAGRLHDIIELCPWAPYRSAMEDLIPPELKWASRHYRRPRGFL